MIQELQGPWDSLGLTRSFSPRCLPRVSITKLLQKQKDYTVHHFYIFLEA